MSSVQTAYSQVAPYKRYVAIDAAHIFDKNGENAESVSQYTVLRDMGKTVYLDDAESTRLRKVQVLPVKDGVSGSGKTGYIQICDCDVPSNQNIVCLN